MLGLKFGYFRTAPRGTDKHRVFALQFQDSGEAETAAALWRAAWHACCPGADDALRAGVPCIPRRGESTECRMLQRRAAEA